MGDLIDLVGIRLKREPSTDENTIALALEEKVRDLDYIRTCETLSVETKIELICFELEKIFHFIAQLPGALGYD